KAAKRTPPFRLWRCDPTCRRIARLGPAAELAKDRVRETDAAPPRERERELAVVEILVEPYAVAVEQSARDRPRGSHLLQHEAEEQRLELLRDRAFRLRRLASRIALERGETVEIGERERGGGFGRHDLLPVRSRSARRAARRRDATLRGSRRDRPARRRRRSRPARSPRASCPGRTGTCATRPARPRCPSAA